MNKLIIDNRTGLTDLEAIKMIQSVIEHGRISNEGKQYCYGTSFNYEGDRFLVWSNLNKKSDRFVILNYNPTR